MSKTFKHGLQKMKILPVNVEFPTGHVVHGFIQIMFAPSNVAQVNETKGNFVQKIANTCFARELPFYETNDTILHFVR